MIKNLIAAAMASILITQPPQNANDETYYQDVNITETYEYETNEVNSVDDLVVGNIYHVYIEKNDLDNIPNLTRMIEFSKLYHYNVNSYLNDGQFHNFYIDLISNINNERFGIFKDTASNFLSINYISTNGNGIGTVITNIYSEIVDLDFYFVYYSIPYQNFISYISESDYLGEKTITIEPVETEGLYNLTYHFLYSRIYTNTELQGMETTLFGTTINMNMWLAHTTAIVIICLLLIVLIKFVIWLFKIVSGGMLWQ